MPGIIWLNAAPQVDADSINLPPPSRSVGLSIRGEAINADRTTLKKGPLPRGRYLLTPLTANTEENNSDLGVRQLGSRPRWMPLNLFPQV